MRATVDSLQYQVDGPIGRVVLNRPEKRNALDAELIRALAAAFLALEEDDSVRIVTLSGAGKDFSAGVDLFGLRRITEASVMENVRDVDEFAELFMLLRRLRKPVVALVQGRALAGGCGLATACDLILAAESASFGYSEINIGFVPAMVMAILRRNVAEKKAFELIVSGEAISAQEAMRIGLINQVFPDAGFAREAEAKVHRLAEKSASATLLCKRLLYLQDGLTFDAAIRAGADVNVIARMTEDTRAGVTAFLDRRRAPGDGEGPEA
jgi:methylglutaconyl-CoA hydratase